MSLFITPDLKQVCASAAVGADFIELHTGAFAEARTASARKREVKRLQQAAELARHLGLRVNAGHGLRATNVKAMRRVPHLETLNIGHSIVSRALVLGMEGAVREMLRAMKTS